MRSLAAVFLGKTILKTSQLLKFGGGSAAPGLYALKVDPNLIKKLASKIPTNIVITGTNGKTTTSRMLAHFAQKQGMKVIRNHTGSNLERGIASTLISNYQLRTTNYQPNLGIWEVDEAAFNSVVLKIQPKIVVFLNVFRDQLDRYGEVDTVAQKWGETLKKLDKNTIVLVNGDDENTAKLATYFKGKVKRFGVKDHKIIGESIEKKKSRGKLDYEAKNVKLNGLSGTSFVLHTTSYPLRPRSEASQLPTTLPLPGIYHIYDFLGAYAAGITLGLDSKKISSSLKTLSPAFGRVEKLSFGYILLIKNPAGATQVFETIAPQFKSNDRLLLALNDNLADGTDVSWIWDGEFEKLLTTNYRLPTICSGTRAYDLANRLKYAGFEPKQIVVKEELQIAFKEALKGLKGRLFVLPTYTAMLQLQAILTKSGIKKPYWEES